MTSSRKTWNPQSETERLEVKGELERILASSPFRSSRRYPALLRYVVEKTLSGEVDALKERTLGIEVFHRTADYDTNADPVVRFSAGEVRRRIAQYYQETSSQSSVEIGLPTGSYIPQFFRFAPAEGLNTIAQNEVADGSEAIEVDRQKLTDHNTSLMGYEEAKAKRPLFPRSFLSGLLVGILAVSVLALVGYFLVRSPSLHDAKTPLSELWNPLLRSSEAVLISAGRTHVEDNEAPEPPNATIEQHILRPEARISFPAVQAISQVTGFLHTQHKPFRIHEAFSNSLQDLHRRPVVLVSGYNNLWTMRLLRPLRFHLEQAGALHYVVDLQHPESRDWSVDFSTPYVKQATDYAIIGRFNDATTQGPVLVVAGIGSNGSEAAGEFVVTPERLETLAKLLPHGSLDQNFEAILKVEVISGSTGAATVIATHTW
jgi:hypothetical protein